MIVVAPPHYCPDCFLRLDARPDSLCRSGQHTGQSQPAPWGAK